MGVWVGERERERDRENTCYCSNDNLNRHPLAFFIWNSSSAYEVMDLVNPLRWETLLHSECLVFVLV